MNKPTVGVQLIIRDEAELLPACLDSVANADEIVVVDTGSTDDSVAIAKTYGAKVYHSEWTDDFAEARNYGLSHGGTDWILVLDADERLHTPLDNIRQLLLESKAAAFTVNIENWLGERPEERLHHRAVRLFRAGQDYRYSGQIHEGIDASIISRHGAPAIEHSMIEIVHLGYLPAVMARKNKVSRNEKLLRRAVAEHPEDDFYSYNLAVACCQNGQLEEAQELLQHTLSRAPLLASYRPSMIRDLCKMYLSAGKMKAIDSLLARELERYSDYPDLHYLQGQSWESQGLPERAFQSYLQAEALCGQQAPREKYVSEHGICTFRPLHRMGVISQQLGKPDEAARLFHRSLQHYPLYAPALLGIVSAFQRLDVPDSDIALLLMRLVPADQAAGRAAIVEALYAADAFAAICGLPQEVFRPEQDTLLRIVSARIITGELKTAEAVIQQNRLRLASMNPNHTLLQELWKLEALCRWGQGKMLPETRLAAIPEPQRACWQWIDRRLARETAEPLESPAAAALPPLAAELVCLSVKLRLYPLATALAQLPPGQQTGLAAALYREGQLQEAGELFIELASDERTAERVAFYLGEMLFDNGHYGEAAGWFQRALEQPGQESAARIGLSVCYLQLALADLENAVNGFGGEYTHGPLLEDIAAVRNAIVLLNRTPWHTVWSCRRQQGGTLP